MTVCLLLSGGMDSLAIAYWKRPKFAVTVDYGQRPAEAETRAAAEVCRQLEIEHFVVCADLSALGSGDLAGKPAIANAPKTEWWPFRNQMLVTLAAMRTIDLGVQRLLIGCLRTDEFHADSRQGFVDQLSNVLEIQEGAMKLEAPAIDLSGDELIIASEVPANLLSWAHSCHVANEACGTCRGCRKHYAILNKLGRTPY